jgi:hypothetical protein
VALRLEPFHPPLISADQRGALATSPSSEQRDVKGVARMTTHIDPRKVALAAALLLFSGVAALVAIAAATSTGSPGAKAAKPMKLEDSTMIVEINATDGDAGIQPFLDGEPWTRMAIFAPNGRRILALDAEGKLNKHGLTELFAESDEPEFSDLPLRKFKKRFPAGTYRFRGETTEGRELVGNAKLSHDLPDGPKITAPTEGQTLSENDAVASWSAGSQPKGVQIVGYEVAVERERPLRVFSADLPASQTSITIPAEFLEPGVKHKIEVLAIERSGNQTITEVPFKVG